MPTDLQHWAYIAQIASPLAILCGVFVAWMAFGRSRHLSLFQKCVDTVGTCNDRYDKLLAVMHVDPDGRKGAQDFFPRFWCLQSDQLDYFILGLIDPLTFTTWNVSLVRAFRDPNKQVAGQTFAEAWQAAAKRYTAEAPVFVEFMSELIKKAQEGNDYVTDRDFCLGLARDIYDSAAVQRFRTHMLERRPDQWDWELDIFRARAPSLNLNRAARRRIPRVRLDWN
ncbi:hypothetical protein [Hyphomicrobium sp.]|uniref:hypothetical protein n=1 Tax=Hyphomicrobium sp. TaxID=82 RepID=UPI0025BFB442|nr:hypothetical protein [Hyphomicrobium sp.]MCC7253671.1 hypothetical protein [Hyphomicrobium sp.]